MLLALLRLVAGLPPGGMLGDRPGGPPAPEASLMALAMLWLETDRFIIGGANRLSCDGGIAMPGPPMAGGGAADGGLDKLGGGALWDAAMGGGGVPVPARVAELERGGGGVAVLAGVFSAPGFLLTQRLRSGS